jgi:hypothetical protein
MSSSTNSELIKSARSVSQYRIKMDDDSDRFVTVIGELHENEFDCDGKSISIYEYCLQRADSNDKCHFMFEYHPDVTDKSRIGSSIIRDVFTNKSNAVESRSVGIDTRTDFISRNAQSLLYNDESGFIKKYGNNALRIKEDYILSYNQNKFINNSGTYEMKSYSKKLNKKFSEYIRKSPSIDDLKWAWAMVMDYTILDKMLEPNDQINEYVVVIGENHCKNIHDTVSKWSEQRIEILSHIHREPGSCIKTDRLMNRY